MSELKHTPGPWNIEWYECLSDIEDVKAKSAKKVGEVLWRVPRSIGPISAGENHWARLHLDVSEEDARLIAAAPELLAIARMIVDAKWTPEDEWPDIEVAANAAIAKALGQ